MRFPRTDFHYINASKLSRISTEWTNSWAMGDTLSTILHLLRKLKDPECNGQTKEQG